jgi:hypothetical protein
MGPYIHIQTCSAAHSLLSTLYQVSFPPQLKVLSLKLATNFNSEPTLRMSKALPP